MENITVKDFAGELERILDVFLPFTDEDFKCLQKRLIKRKNRDLLKRVLMTLAADQYGAFVFKEHKPWNDR